MFVEKKKYKQIIQYNKRKINKQYHYIVAGHGSEGSKINEKKRGKCKLLKSRELNEHERRKQ